MRKLLHWRQGKKVISEGKLMQFIPENNLYVYFRYNDNQCVMVAFNSADKAQTFSTDRFQERMTGYYSAINVVTGGEDRRSERAEYSGEIGDGLRVEEIRIPHLALADLKYFLSIRYKMRLELYPSSAIS